LAILDGKWIVSVDCTLKHHVNIVGYLKSLSSGQWLPEEEYEVKGDQINGSTNAPAKGRKSPNSLLNGLSFYIDHELDPKGPRREELAALIKTGGGTLITRRPVQSIDKCIIIKEENDKKRLLNMISMFDASIQ
jgi:hypothetical protein